MTTTKENDFDYMTLPCFESRLHIGGRSTLVNTKDTHPKLQYALYVAENVCRSFESAFIFCCMFVASRIPLHNIFFFLKRVEIVKGR